MPALLLSGTPFKFNLLLFQLMLLTGASTKVEFSQIAVKKPITTLSSSLVLKMMLGLLRTPGVPLGVKTVTSDLLTEIPAVLLTSPSTLLLDRLNMII